MKECPMTTFETKSHKTETTESGYVLKVYESDPYYHVEVTKDGKTVDDHLLMNDTDELAELCRKYEKI